MAWRLQIKGKAIGTTQRGPTASLPRTAYLPKADMLAQRALSLNSGSGTFCDIAIGRADVRTWGMSGPKIQRDLGLPGC